jgi:N-carbamoyl-L-amino-acid hydrolase
VTAAPRVDGERLWDRLTAMAQIGATPDGGVRRIAASPEDAAARALLYTWADAAGYRIRIDEIGNGFITRPGRRSELPAAMVGSHLDTQPGGGRFDGALGVIAGLELMSTLDDAEIETDRPVELAVWTDEEGARSAISCVGSAVFSGALAVDDARLLIDDNGTTLVDALREVGMAGNAPIREQLPAAYFELHIEQGPVLEDSGKVIGVPVGIPGIRWIEVDLVGTEAHAGSAPMDRRRDALLAAAGVINAVDGIARKHGRDARATVCRSEVQPNAGSVIVGRCRLLVDLRHPDPTTLDVMQRELIECVPPTVKPRFCDVWVQPPFVFAAGCIECVRSAARELGHDPLQMLSGAGHDAGYLSTVVPTAMVFVPSRGGISHHPDEWTEREHVQAGADVLLGAVLPCATKPGR